MGQDVLQKAAEERDGVEGAPPHEARPAIAVAERHLAVLELFEAAVDDRNAEDVARQVIEHLLARARVLKLSRAWPWKEAFLACWQRLCALPAPA